MEVRLVREFVRGWRRLGYRFISWGWGCEVMGVLLWGWEDDWKMVRGVSWGLVEELGNLFWLKRLWVLCRVHKNWSYYVEGSKKFKNWSWESGLYKGPVKGALEGVLLSWFCEGSLEFAGWMIKKFLKQVPGVVLAGWFSYKGEVIVSSCQFSSKGVEGVQFCRVFIQLFLLFS